MKQFDIRRFGALLRYDCSVFGLKMAFWFAFFVALAPAFSFMDKHGGMGLVFYFWIMPFLVLGLVGDMVNKKFVRLDSGTSYVMLPATPAEKWAAALLEAVLILGPVTILTRRLAVWIMVCLGDVANHELSYWLHPILESSSIEFWRGYTVLFFFAMLFVYLTLRIKRWSGGMAFSIVYMIALVYVDFAIELNFRHQYPDMYNAVGAIWECSWPYLMLVANVLMLWHSYRLVRTRNVY